MEYIFRGVRYTALSPFRGVSYTVEFFKSLSVRLGGVTYTAERPFGGERYTTEWPFGGVSYTAEWPFASV